MSKKPIIGLLIFFILQSTCLFSEVPREEDYRKIASETFSANDKLESKIESSYYDTSNKIAKLMFTMYIGGDRLLHFEVYEYFPDWKVKRIYGEEYNSSTFSITYEYNDQGLLIVYNYYCLSTKDFDFGLESSRTYEYDERGTQTKEVISSISSSGEESKTIRDYEYEYDDKNRIIEKTDYKNGEFVIKVTFKYDENDNILEKLSWKEGIISQRTIYEYDENNNVTVEACYDKEGVVTQRTIYEYDENNNVTVKILYDSEGKETSRFNYEYNGELLIKLTKYKDSELDSYTVYTWEPIGEP